MKGYLKEILKDEKYSEDDSFSKRKSLKRKCLEEAIDTIRFELLYPKLKEGKSGKYTNGLFPALVTNMTAGALVSEQYHHAEGIIFGGVITMAQFFLGNYVRDFSKYISEKYKGINAKE
jgi:hypothetical protein